MPEEKQEEQVIVEKPTVNPFSDDSWSETLTIAEEKKEEPKAEEKKIESVVEKPTEVAEEVVEEDELYKREFGKSKQEFKVEYEELKKFRETKPEETKFVNEESKRLYEAIRDKKDDVVLEILDTKRKLSSIEKLNAQDSLKLHIELTNKHYKQADINDVFEEKYSYPEKPLQGDAEEDTDFNARLSKWEESKAKVDRRVERDAVSAKTELAKLNTELTLPDIKKETENPLTPEAQQKELERIEGVRNQFLKVLESDYSKFNGYEVKAKDGEVELPVAYVVTDQQKSALKDELKDFDVDGFIEKRWFVGGQPNISQMMEDIFLLRNKGDIFQKIANEAASKRLVHHLGTQSKIDVNGKSEKPFQPNGEKNDLQKMQEFFWNQS